MQLGPGECVALSLHQASRSLSLRSQALNTQRCSLTLRPLEEEGLEPLPSSPTSICPQLLTSPSWNHSPMTLTLMLHWPTWRTFALIWLGQLQAGPPPPAQPPQACLSHFVFLRFGCGAQWASLQTHFLVESLLTAQCCELLGLLLLALLCSGHPLGLVANPPPPGC